MYFDFVRPDDADRIKFMAESAIEAYENPPVNALYYIGMFSDAVRQCKLSEQRPIARNTIIKVLGTHYDYEKQTQIVECLMLFSYLCGWKGADAIFQKSLHQMKLNTGAAA
jgi:hypothetical protein